MIVDISEETLDQISHYFDLDLIVYLKIFKADNSIKMDYNLISNYDPYDKTKFMITMHNSINARNQIKKSLEDLKKATQENLKINEFEVLYDCTTDNSLALYRSSVSIDNLHVIEQKKDLSDALALLENNNKNVPGIFKKMSTKKYNSVTYSQIAELIKKEFELD